ncbi:cytochrome P450 [Daldinia caldariorum]|uniref:cytochrome P450 n=1 Tax=Daldinia caldariorum TaxID=326644 RepID=UPI002008AFA6|nr:cytochrome P450 [Daldinia caldariorum]KAI1466125.1 cytochrome P450 [Daldinia caldariorum]
MYDQIRSTTLYASSLLGDVQILRIFSFSLLLVFGGWWIRSLSVQLDPREPPALNPKIPIVGHVWGLMRHAHGYINSLHRQSGLSIYTLPLLHRKVYVINSPTLVQAAFANRRLSFMPFVVDFVKRMDELSPSARGIYAEIHPQVMQSISTHMTGKQLKRKNSVQLKEFFPYLPEDGVALEVDNLWFWLRDILTVGTTSMLFGPKDNPWKKHPSLVKAYWNFEAGDPSRRFNLTAVGNRRTSMYHATMHAALIKYFATCYDSSIASEDNGVAEMIRDAVALQRRSGFNVQDVAASQLAIVHGSIVSTVPTAFWAIAYAFSQPELLAKLREDALAAVTFEDIEGTGMRRAIVLNDQIDVVCPLLVATLHETQRLVSIGLLHRRVLEDTQVSEGAGEAKRTYLLKKGTAIFLASGPSHRNEQIWGETSDEFRLDRLQESAVDRAYQNGQEKARQVVRSRNKAYFPFGGGKELCPGRNFAASEALSTLLVMVLGFDMFTPDGTPLKIPPFSPPKMTASVARPHKNADLRANIKRRNIVFLETSKQANYLFI